MKLYSGSSQEFFLDVVQDRVAQKMTDAFFEYFRYKPAVQEIQSWRNSLRAISQVCQFASLNDHGVILEYQLPLTSKRLDFMICGYDQLNKQNAVVVELKQWDKCIATEGPNEVASWVAGRERELLHPSVQVQRYRNFLVDNHESFYETAPNRIQVGACAYLHNYHFVKDDPILAEKFEPVMEDCHLFSADDFEKLHEYLRSRLSAGDGMKILRSVEDGKHRPSKKLLAHVGDVIAGKPEYHLLDEQLIAFDRVIIAAQQNLEQKKKSVILINGGPGTGKSVIAMNLLGQLSARGYNAHYATGSKAFTETVRKIIGVRGAQQVKYFNSYMQAPENAVDVIICDEAHRIRKTSNNRFTKKEFRSDKPQIEELLDVGQVCVFFVDDRQVVRPGETGSLELIRAAAQARGYELHEYTLEAQFRCGGSDGFINWVNNTLGIERTANVMWNNEEKFDFRVVDSPEELERIIRARADEGNSARMMAGYCWPWSDPTPDGQLVEDVKIGNWSRPWNARSGAGRLAKGIPKESLWAHELGGINQVGCVYTAQGFEFDYAGVIIGNDLKYDPVKNEWIAIKENNFDTTVKRSKEQMVDLLKNTYRVLLTRGIKGCYVYFMDEDTRNFVRSRME